MTNRYFVEKLQAEIDSAVAKYRTEALLQHGGLTGSAREILVDALLRQVLIKSCSVGTGKITDHNGQMSHQVDVVLYSPTVLPSFMTTDRDGVFPVESCIYAIEVKSRLTSTEVRDAVAKADSLKSLVYGEANTGLIRYRQTPVIPALFAFESDLTSAGTAELERILRLDPHTGGLPAFRAICILGRGYWWFHPTDEEQYAPGQWRGSPFTENYGEVFGFLAGVANTVPNVLRSRGQPNFGPYILG